MLVLSSKLPLKSSSVAYFYDTTGATGGNSYGVGGNIDYSDVKGIRIKTATYSTLNNASQPESGVFVQWLEYNKTGGLPETINNKTFVAGETFVPQSSGISTSYPEDWITTGYYVYPFLATWLPTGAEVPLEISVSQFNQSGDNISDNIYIYDYEVYDNRHSGNFTASADQAYMVLSGNATYDSDIFYAGEIFLASTATSVLVSGSVVELYASTTGYSTLVPGIIEDLNDLIEQQIGLNNQDLVQPQEGYILKIRTKLEALEYSCKTMNVSLLYSYETIQAIQAKLLQLLSL